MFHESEIMVRILLRCHDAGVPVLPLHDGLCAAVPMAGGEGGDARCLLHVYRFLR